MALVEYDLDLSGGLMEDIQRLVAPPQSETTSRRQRLKERDYYRRPAKGQNHDCCDSCKEGGDLVCCDRCPASFHLLCHDPPLEEEDVPPGMWLCHKCRVKPPQEDDDSASTCSSKSRISEQSSSTTTTGAHAKKPHKHMREDEPMEIEILPEDANKHPLQILAKAASFMNPKQFDIPKDQVCHLNFPGSSKRKYWGRERNVPKKLPHELDNGMVPLPAKLCFLCGRSCRFAPLIQCDYCPLLFHMDCLNPPLTSMPSGRWMCPNHMEHSLDSKFLTSEKLTERIKLWDQYTGPVNQQTIKVKFLNRIHRRNPPFRYKVRHARKATIRVPDTIKAHYEFRPPLLPRADEATDQKEAPVVTSQDGPTPQEQEEWLAAVVGLHTSIARHLSKKDSTKEEAETTSSVAMTTSSTGSKPTASVTPVVKHEQPSTSAMETTSSSSSSSTTSGNQGNQDNNNESKYLNGPATFHPELANGGTCGFKPGHQVSLLNSPTAVATTNANGELNILKPSELPGRDRDVIGARAPPTTAAARAGNNVIKVNVSSQGKTLAGRGNLGNTVLMSPSARQGKVTTPTGSKVITVTTPTQGKLGSPGIKAPGTTPIGSSAIYNLSNTLQTCVEGNNEIEISKLDERLIQILAYQRLQQLAPPRGGYSNQFGHDARGQEVRARALLCPLTGKGQPVQMSYRSLTIGTGADMDVCLSTFGSCSYVSSKHACIFYDEASRHYELLNYSEHGTTVDNVLYSCDFSEKITGTTRPNNVISSVRSLINTKTRGGRHDNQEEEAEKNRMSSNKLPERVCSCKTSSSSLIGGSGAGWEGTAVLHHGSYIKVGCLQFVFSIVEHATQEPLIEVKREATSLLKTPLLSPLLS